MTKYSENKSISSKSDSELGKEMQKMHLETMRIIRRSIFLNNLQQYRNDEIQAFKELENRLLIGLLIIFIIGIFLNYVLNASLLK